MSGRRKAARRDWGLWVTVEDPEHGVSRFHVCIARDIPRMEAGVRSEPARVVMVQVMPSRAVAQVVMRGLQDAWHEYHAADGTFQFRLDSARDKAAFHGACADQFDRHLRPGWRWRYVRVMGTDGRRTVDG